MLTENKYAFFTSKEIKPSGWLKKQLQIQMDGLSGHLHEIWPDIRDSKWIGGDKEGWERVPYWLDGFIPLAYLLQDQEKIEVAKRYIDAIIAGQRPDGWICPCEDHERSRYDVWATFLICKVLVVYYECSGDERIVNVVRRALENLKVHIRGNTLFNWAAARWFECLIPIYWLYEKTHEDWLIYLAHALNVQGTDYKLLFDEWKDQISTTYWTQQTHVVNLAMALKAPILASRYKQADNALESAIADADNMYDSIMKYHGTAVGHFTGDECLAGNSPIQGSELCSVVEAMYSYEQNFAVTGDAKWLDRLETLAYNDLPATNSPDMWTHQYDQMVNQIACVRFMGKPIFGTNSQEAHLFGLEPNYGCCTANFNQGWPKFALSTFMQKENGVLVTSVAPATLECKVNGVGTRISVDTLYPFENTMKISVDTDSPNSFDLDIRIPASAASAKLDGKDVAVGSIVTVNRVWEGHSDLTLELEFECVLEDRPHDMYVLRRGPLYYSVNIGEQWKMHEYVRHGVERKYPYCDYEIYPTTKWNYAFTDCDFKVETHGITDYPFSSEFPPITLKANLCEIDWGMEDGYNDVCAAVPKSRVPLGDSYEVDMKPYGCTNLRMTEMPKI